VRGELKAGTEAKKAAQRPSKAVVARPAEVEQQLGELAKHDPKPVKPKSAEPIPKGLREVEVKFKNGAVARYLERQPTLKGPLNPEQLGAIAQRIVEVGHVAPHIDKQALEVAKEEARKREEFRKKESEERIRKMRERLGADSDDKQSGHNTGGTMAAAKKASKTAKKVATPSAATAKRVSKQFDADQKITWLIKENPRSLTGQYLTGERMIPVSDSPNGMLENNRRSTPSVQ